MQHMIGEAWNQNKNQEGMTSYHLERSISDQFDVARLPEYVGFSRQTLQSLKRRVNHKTELSLTAVAQDLGITPRTLERRLQSEGIDFDQILEKVRRYYALHLVVQIDTPIADISMALGFSDEEQFNFSFCLWTGLSASAFQRLFQRVVRA